MKHGDLENIILNALWNIDDDEYEMADVANILQLINQNNKKWAYTTVKTVLDRLAEKRLISRIRQNKKYFYKPIVSRQDAGNAAIKKLIAQYFNNNIEDCVDAVEKLRMEALVLR